MTLGDRFLDAATSPIDVDGRPIHSVVEIELAGSCTVDVRRESCRDDRVQTVELALSHGSLKVNGVNAPTLSLRSDTAPQDVPVDVTSDLPTVLRVWNGWVSDGVHHAWTGNAGVELDVDATCHTLRCSDGIGRADFDDLVITLRIDQP